MLPALAGDLAGGSGDRRAGAQMRPGGFGTQPPGWSPAGLPRINDDTLTPMTWPPPTSSWPRWDAAGAT